MDIDIVYLWVDGNDPAWLKKRQPYLKTEINTTGRYQDNQELKYSLRSIDQHLPWIRKIFIVTDQQIPPFVDINHPKIEIIDHTTLLPKEILPTFNSSVLDYFVYKIPGLSEHFLYANDDMFVYDDLSPSFFFQEGVPILRMKYNPLIHYKIQFKKLFHLRINNYRLAIENAYTIFKNKFNRFYPITSHHNIDACLKSDYQRIVEEVFAEELAPSFRNRFRDKTDIQRILIIYYGLVNKTGVLKYVGRKESCRIRVHRSNYDKYIRKYNPQLFCLNDTEHANDSHRAQVAPFLEKLFPNKAAFEK